MNLQVALKIFLKTDFRIMWHQRLWLLLNFLVPKYLILDFVVKLVPQHLKCVNPMAYQFLIESKQKTIACDVEFQTVFGL